MPVGRLALVAVIAFSTSVLVIRTLTPDPSDELKVHVGPDTRLLVVSPHPDDEALAAAGLIQRVRSAGGSVRVALMTSGDAFPEGVETALHVANPRPRDYRNYGNVRERETIEAMRHLGVDRAHILFLGFPDGGLCLTASKYLSAKGAAFASPYTGRVEPPTTEQVIRGVTYRGSDIRRELESVIAAYVPTLIALPHTEDDHPDHCATGIFTHEALAALSTAGARRPALLQYLIHFDSWPSLSDDAARPLEPPTRFPQGEGDWKTFRLTDAETAAKRQALDQYVSQTMVIGRFLRAFGRPNELFVEGRAAATPECWCDDEHVATEARPDRYRRRPPRNR